MDSLVRNAIVNASGAERARLIGCAHNYISDNNFTNLLQNIDINNPKKFNYSMFAAFNSVPGLREQVLEWLDNA